MLQQVQRLEVFSVLFHHLLILLYPLLPVLLLQVFQYLFVVLLVRAFLFLCVNTNLTLLTSFFLLILYVYCRIPCGRFPAP